MTPDPGQFPPGGLAALLTLEQEAPDTFRAPGAPGKKARLYGGQLAAQALAAACRTAAGRRPHSLHAYFLRPGEVTEPLVFRVERLQDGPARWRRRVTVTQRGASILGLEASLAADVAEVTSHQPPPRVPPPEDCPEFLPRWVFARRLWPWHMLAARMVPGRAAVPGALTFTGDAWFRFREPVPAGVRPEVLLTYLSDLTLGATLLRPSERHPAGRPDITGLSSLDHSLWFHNPADLSGVAAARQGTASRGRGARPGRRARVQRRGSAGRHRDPGGPAA